jgi:chromate transporter
MRGGSVREVFAVALRLGLTSFGGPIAHLGYFRREYVERRRWLDEATFAELVALCQSLPGPASSQLGIAIGTLRAGLRGGIAAWLGFTAPSAVALVLFAELVGSADLASAGWLHGLKLVAAAVVGHAIFLMSRSLTPDWLRRAMAIGAAAVAILFPSSLIQVALIGVGGLVGVMLVRTSLDAARAVVPVHVSPRLGAACLVAFAILLIALPLARAFVSQAPSLAWAAQPVADVDVFYRAGALVFGGGHVILPLLHEAVVPSGWVSDDAFLAGYGAAQAVPGPLSTFAGYLGDVFRPAPNGPLGAVIALGAIFLPSFLLVFGALPFWGGLRNLPRAAAALAGTNAAVVGLLIAALWDPIWTGAVRSVADVAVVAIDGVLLVVLRWPPWSVVLVSTVLGAAVVAGGWSAA